MAATINTNITSINAQRNLSFSGQSLNTTMQRLSSGLRVNSAKDDAAGLAIAERMNTQVKGMTVASRNANDGISLAQTTEGALGKIGDMLQRMRELAVQAGNATNSKSDREALQLEVKQLSDEVDRVAKQTNFNGQKVLDGSFAGAVFQVGANSGDNITLGALVDTRAVKLSTVSYGEANILTPGIYTGMGDDNNDLLIEDFAKPIPNEDDPDPLTITYTIVDAAGDEADYEVELGAIQPATNPAERLGQVIEAINNRTADTGVTAYLSKLEGTDSFELFIVSSRLGGNGEPASIEFSYSFTKELTGLDS
ncbi:MAG: flagellin, partial [Comamonas sp.]|nr:flagellin [Comamonas sp.]